MASSTPQLLLLVILLTVDAILLVEARPPENKIVGGEKYDIKYVPWQVILHIGKYLCGGSIINERWILTAAHCTVGTRASAVTIIAGTSFQDRGGTKYRGADIKNHPRYHNSLYHNDISLVMTDRPIVFGELVAKATLPRAGAPPPQVGTEVIVSGWGVYYNGGGDKPPTSNQLLAAMIKMENFANCQAAFRDKSPDPSTQLCAGLKGRDACGGDSGGPLVAGNVVIGIVSYGNKKICGAHPGVYTKVSAYVDWINGHTRI